jgi:hypothetical protein
MDKDADDIGSNTAAGVLITISVLLPIAGNCVASRGTQASSGSSIRARLFGAAWRMFGSAQQKRGN